MAEQKTNTELLMLTTEIAAAHFSNNEVGAEELPSVIQAIYRTLAGLGGMDASSSGAANFGTRPDAAVSVKKSVTPDYIICLEDGKKLKMLKRHLRSAYNMTPEQYRQRWDLPTDYPMVAPNYAKRRSQLAKDIGLGTTGGRGRGRPKKAANTSVQPGVKRGRGRPRKAA